MASVLEIHRQDKGPVEYKAIVCSVSSNEFSSMDKRSALLRSHVHGWILTANHWLRVSIMWLLTFVCCELTKEHSELVGHHLLDRLLNAMYDPFILLPC